MSSLDSRRRRPPTRHGHHPNGAPPVPPPRKGVVAQPSERMQRATTNHDFDPEGIGLQSLVAKGQLRSTSNLTTKKQLVQKKEQTQAQGGEGAGTKRNGQQQILKNRTSAIMNPLEQAKLNQGGGIFSRSNPVQGASTQQQQQHHRFHAKDPRWGGTSDRSSHATKQMKIGEIPKPKPGKVAVAAARDTDTVDMTGEMSSSNTYAMANMDQRIPRKQSITDKTHSYSSTVSQKDKINLCDSSDSDTVTEDSPSRKSQTSSVARRKTKRNIDSDSDYEEIQGTKKSTTKKRPRQDLDLLSQESESVAAAATVQKVVGEIGKEVLTPKSPIYRMYDTVCDTLRSAQDFSFRFSKANSKGDLSTNRSEDLTDTPEPKEMHMPTTTTTHADSAIRKRLGTTFGKRKLVDSKRTAATHIHPGDAIRTQVETTHRDNRERRQGFLEPFTVKHEILESRPSRPRRTSTRSLKQPETIDLQDSDDDVELVSGPKELASHQLTRYSIGKRVTGFACHLRIVAEDEMTKLIVSGLTQKRSTRGSPGDAELEEHTFSFSDITHIAFYIPDVPDEVESNEPVEDDDADVSSFLAIQVKPRNVNGLTKFNTSYEVGAKAGSGKRYILIEFHNDADLHNILRQLKEGKTDCDSIRKLKPSEAKDYAKAFIDDTKRESERRLTSFSPSTKKKAGFVANLASNDILVTYPFDGDRSKMDKAGEDLNETSGVLDALPSPSEAEAASEEDARGDGEAKATSFGRGHYMTVRVTDYDRLEATEYLNDTLVDFWMAWISRHCDRSDFHIFSSHFYTTLDDEGVAAVTKWTKNKNINIFLKKFIIIPVNQSLHWSLCVIVNPSFVAEYRAFDNEAQVPDNQRVPSIVFLDSLKAHRKLLVARNVYKWLNSEWKRLEISAEENLFNATTMNLHTPEIPYQDNGWDCGVFTCRYAYAMLKLRHHNFTKSECGIDTSHPFRDLITNSEAFNFGMNDIRRIRGDFRNLLERLTSVYRPWKEEVDRKEEEEKLAAKRKRTEKAELNAEDAKEDHRQSHESDACDVVGGTGRLESDGRAASQLDSATELSSWGHLNASHSLGTRTNVELSDSLRYSSPMATEFSKSALPEPEQDAEGESVALFGPRKAENLDDFALQTQDEDSDDSQPAGPLDSPLPRRFGADLEAGMRDMHVSPDSKRSPFPGVDLRNASPAEKDPRTEYDNVGNCTAQPDFETIDRAKV